MIQMTRAQNDSMRSKAATDNMTDAEWEAYGHWCDLELLQKGYEAHKANGTLEAPRFQAYLSRIRQQMFVIALAFQRWFREGHDALCYAPTPQQLEEFIEDYLKEHPGYGYLTTGILS